MILIINNTNLSNNIKIIENNNITLKSKIIKKI